MRLGVVFPQLESGTNPDDIRAYTEAVDQLGYDHITIFDHVLGVDPATAVRPNAYTYVSLFHEPMVLFGYMAAVAPRLELCTGILILPQRQTALVAKQAAEVALLARGGFRLGVGVGWNPAEYSGLGEDFHTRGRRVEEQVGLLRRLWAEPLLSFEGRFDRIDAAGINPLPPGGSIPIWFGGMADAVIERVGRLGDGWFPQYRDPSQLPEGIALVKEAAVAAGRDPEAIGFEARVPASLGTDAAVELGQRWIEAGATHLAINTMDAGFRSMSAHIEAVQGFIEGVRAGQPR